MLTIFVYVCFIVGFVDILRVFFRFLGYIINPEKFKKGGFLSGKFRNNDRKSEPVRRSDRDSDGGFNRSDYRNNCDDGTGDVYDDNRMSDIAVKRTEC